MPLSASSTSSLAALAPFENDGPSAAIGVQPDQTPEPTRDPFDSISLMDEIRQKLPEVPPPRAGKRKLRHPLPGNSIEAWQKCSHLVEKYDAGLCQTYREQIDTLLVFAGLFSAVVTAFTIESYQWLQDDPNEKTAELLAQIANLLASNHSIANPHPVSSPVHDSAVVRINTYWFLALTISLSSALVAIVCKQWLREFERDVGSSHKKALGIRQMKFEGLNVWRVGDIVSFVPLLLQLALALFMIGVLELLWRLHTTVAATITAVSGLTLLFYTATTFLPLIQYVGLHFQRLNRYWPVIRTAPVPTQCPYKSPQAWLALRAVLYVTRLFFDGFSKYLFEEGDSWLSFDLRWTERVDRIPTEATYPFRALAWLVRTVEVTELSTWIWHCLWADFEDGAMAIEHNGNLVLATQLSNLHRHTQNVPPMGALHGLDMQELKVLSHRMHWLLLVYLVEVQGAHGIHQECLNAVAEIFLRVTEVHLSLEWSAKCLHRIRDKMRYGTGHRLDQNLATALFRLVERLLADNLESEVQPSPQLAQELVCCTIDVFRRAELCEELIAATCVCATNWLRSTRIPKSSPNDKRICVKMGCMIVGAVLTHHWNHLRLKPADLQNTPYIRVLASLTRYSVELWRDSFSTAQDVDWKYFPTDFRSDYRTELLKIAGSDIVILDAPEHRIQRASVASLPAPFESEPIPAPTPPPATAGSG